MAINSSVLVAELSFEGPASELSLTLFRSVFLGMSMCHTSFAQPPRIHFSAQELLELVVVSLLIEDAFLKSITVNDI